MKKGILVFAIAVVIMLISSAVVVSIFLSRTDKKREESFASIEQPVAGKIIDRCFCNTISMENEDVEAKREELFGGSLSDEEIQGQFSNWLSAETGQLNVVGQVYDEEETGRIYDAYYFYDADMNSLMIENTLLLVKTDSVDDVKTNVSFSFQDDDFTESMKNLRQQVGVDYESMGFHIENAYIKDDTFIPEKITYYAKNSNGTTSSENELYSNADDKDTMIKNGYEYYEIDDEFGFGETFYKNKDDSFVIYVGETDEKIKDRVNELLEESQKQHSGENTYTITKRLDGYENEIFSYNTYEAEGNVYHGVIYSYRDSMISVLESVTLPGAGLGDFIFLIVGLIASFVVPMVAAVIILKPKKRK